MGCDDEIRWDVMGWDRVRYERRRRGCGDYPMLMKRLLSIEGRSLQYFSLILVHRFKRCVQRK